MKRRSAILWLALPGALAACGGGSGGPVTPPIPYEVTVSLDVATRYQVMQGFGGALGFYVNWLTGHPQRQEIYDLIFGDLGLQVLRIGNWYQNTGGAAFDDSVAVAQAARATAGDGRLPLVLLSSWSPPASLKSNGMTRMGGSLARDAEGAYRYGDFGAWWAESLGAYAAAGVVPDFISIQNEPDFIATGWESCLFDPSETAANAGYDQAVQAVSAAMTANGIDPRPRMIGPETSGIANRRVESYVAALEAGPAIADIDGIAHHLYSGGSASYPASFSSGMAGLASTAASSGKPLLMTEYGAASDLLGTAWLIHNAVTIEGVSAYYIWSLTWAPPGGGSSTPGGLVTTENPFNRTSWRTTTGYVVNDAYYAVRHFSKWIGVGWQRVAITTSASPVRVSAFISPDEQQVTVVLLNTDDDAHAVTVDLGDTGGRAFPTTAVYRTSGTDERTAPLGPLPDGGEIVLPGGALATVTFGP